MEATKKTGWGGARATSGPKPKPAEERRRNQIVFRLTDDELSQLEDAAGDERTTVFARKVLLRYLARRRK